MKRLIELAVVITLILSASLLLLYSGNYLIPGSDVRSLALFYLYTTYNPLVSSYTVNSPEAVTAIVWDYRGLDTLFETSVFYLALIGGLALVRKLYNESIPGNLDIRMSGLSVIVKTVTRITMPMILAVGVSIGLHGHLTPGGGFQGGSTLAVVPMIVIVVFSTIALISRGMSSRRLLLLRILGLLGIGLTSISVFLLGLILGVPAYVFQNMPKSDAQIGLPARVGTMLISGTLWFFNLFEMIAVMAGFSLAFIALLLVGRSSGVRS